MQQYSYKNSGIEWLSTIPEHWGVTKVKKEFRVIPSNVDKKSQDEEEEVKLCNYVDVYYNDFITSQIEFMVATASEHEIKKFQLQIGDILITKDSEDPFDIAVPALVKETEDKLLCGYHLSMIRTINRKIDGAFLFWSLKDDSIVSQLFREATGVTRWAIASRHIKDSTIAFPPLPEQRAIADYLDKACARIDRIIAIKEEQLRKIEAQEKSKAFEILTRGIKDNVPMKNSEIHWMDKMPNHWRRLRLKDVVFLRSGDSITSTDINEFEEFPVYGGNGLRGFTDSYTHEGYYPLIGRQGALCGNINYAEGKFYASEHAVVATPVRKCDVYWIGELMRIMNLNQYSNAAAQPGLAVERIKQLYIPYPSFDEQIEISLLLKDLFERNSRMKKLLHSQISTLQSYRKSLIHECVTGKKQVYTGELKIKEVTA